MPRIDYERNKRGSIMMVWEFSVTKTSEPSPQFAVPADKLTRDQAKEVCRLLAAQGLSEREIVGCFWSKHHGRLELLDVSEQDEGRTLTVGDGDFAVYARQIWVPDKSEAN